MNIAFDWHGTLDSYESLRNNFKDLYDKGHNMIILTGLRSKDLFPKTLLFPELLNVSFKMISIYEYTEELGIKGTDKNDIDENLYWAMKSVLCKNYNIDILVDDSEKFLEYFNEKLHRTKFILASENAVVL